MLVEWYHDLSRRDVGHKVGIVDYSIGLWHKCVKIVSKGFIPTARLSVSVEVDVFTSGYATKYYIYRSERCDRST